MSRAADENSTVTLPELARLLRDADAAARLVSPWLLRRIAAYDRGAGGWPGRVPHGHLHAIRRDRLIDIAERENLPLGDDLAGLPPSPESASPRPTAAPSNGHPSNGDAARGGDETAAGAPWPPLILLAAPDEDWLAATPREAVLARYWALLFHARLDAHFRDLFAAGGGGGDHDHDHDGAGDRGRRAAGPAGRPAGRAAAAAGAAARRAAVQSRIDRVGRAAFHEARAVLRKDRWLAASADDAAAYAEFAAVFLEIRHFAPARLPWYFPAAAGGPDDVERVLNVFAEDVDAPGLRRDTRPAGTREPDPRAGGAWGADGADAAAPDDLPPPLPEPRRRRGRGGKSGRGAREAKEARGARDVRGAARAADLLARADAAGAAGNTVRAALLRMTAYRLGRPGGGEIHGRARQDLAVLVARLQAALGLDDAAADAWRAALGPLLAHAAGGWWNPEGRLLYDLQKVCLDVEREIYSVSVVDWLLDWRRWRARPLRQSLPRQRPVLVCKHLRTAAGRVAGARLGPGRRAALHALLRDALHGAEARLRDDLRPPVVAALDAAGLRPRGAVERAARGKLVEELLDHVVGRGFLDMGKVRDAVSRNALKLDDLAGPAEFYHGDQLLRADRRLKASLAGVYRGGEIYLRQFQRFSSVLFATTAGRLVTLTVLIPFGGAFLILSGFDHTVGAIVHKATGAHVVTARAVPILAVGFFLLAVVNWPAFRRAAGRAARAVGRGLRRAFVDLPKWVAARPVVRAVVDSEAARLAGRYVLKPLPVAAAAWLLTPAAAGPAARAGVALAALAGASALVNSRAGRRLEHAVVDGMRLVWTRLAVGVLGDLVNAVAGFFQDVLEQFDRLLYQVDEWLRFRGGQGRRTLVLKAVVGFFWFFVAYAARFVINLLVEPQVNPIKHFPVVTVSHKLILPTAFPLGTALQRVGVEKVRANFLAASIVSAIPGVFGFLAWEFKENWKLYRANRPRTLRPVPVGSHGETIARFLRPGFHSGTVPKLFTRLRRLPSRGGGGGASAGDAGGEPSPRYAGAAGAARAARKAQKLLDELDHVRQAVAAFVARELVALLDGDAAWQAFPVSVGAIRLGPTRIEVSLACPAAGPAPVRFSFEQRSGWILAGIDEPGWAAGLPGPRAASLAAGLLGLYRLAGADLVREQVAALFAPRLVRWDVRGRGLVVWPDDAFTVEATYDLRPGPVAPHYEPAAAGVALPVLDGDQLLLPLAGLNWASWVAAWEPDPSATVEGRRGFFPTLRVLPSGDADDIGPVPTRASHPHNGRDTSGPLSPVPGGEG